MRRGLLGETRSSSVSTRVVPAFRGRSGSVLAPRADAASRRCDQGPWGMPEVAIRRRVAKLTRTCQYSDKAEFAGNAESATTVLAAYHTPCRLPLYNAPMDDEGFDVGARLRAARHLAGFRHQRDLALAIDQAGLGERTLRAIELGRRHATERDFRAIADACRVPLEWFTADFSRLAEISDPPREVLRAEREKVSARSAARSGGKPEETQPPHWEAQVL